MSNTPRTDDQINGKPCTRFAILAGDSLRSASVPSEFARQLERELNAANAEIEEKRKDVVWLATEKAKLAERIKRLEEAGDRLQMLIEEQGWWESVPQEMWRKAKDAK